jgi:hypothetical protein
VLLSAQVDALVRTGRQTLFHADNLKPVPIRFWDLLGFGESLDKLVTVFNWMYRYSQNVTHFGIMVFEQNSFV